MKGWLAGLFILAGCPGPAWAEAQPVFAEPRFDEATGVLTLPYTGARPGLVSIDSPGDTVVIDVPHAEYPTLESFRPVTGSRAVRALLAAYDPEIKGLHLVLQGTGPLSVKAEGGMELSFRIAPRPRVLPARPPANPGLPIRFGLVTGGFNEDYAPELVSAGTGGVWQAGLEWRGQARGLVWPVRLARRAFRLADPDYLGVTHDRVETDGLVAVGRAYAWQGFQLGTEAGYRLDWTQVTSSAQPADPTFSFRPSLVFHGPVLRQEVDRGLWGPLGAACTMEWSPWVFAQVSGSAPFGYLTAFRIEPRLYLWSDQKVSLGYLWDWTVGPSYDRTLTGMTLTIGFGGP